MISFSLAMLLVFDNGNKKNEMEGKKKRKGKKIFLSFSNVTNLVYGRS